METLIIYYSYTGNTKKIAVKKARELNASTIELLDIKKRGKFRTYTGGSFAAMRRRKAKLQPFNQDFTAYGKIIIATPIWAGNPAPAFNNLLPLVKGKEVELIFSNGGGYKDKMGLKAKALLEKNGAKVTNITVFKGAGE